MRTQVFFHDKSSVSGNGWESREAAIRVIEKGIREKEIYKVIHAENHK